MSEYDETRAAILHAFGLKPWDITSAVRPPLRVRIWRAVTFAKRRGKVIDWSSYEAAEAEFLAREAEYEANMPGRMQEIADRLSECLPEGMRFEWDEGERPGGDAHCHRGLCIRSSAHASGV